MRLLFPGGPAPFQAQGDTRRNNSTGCGHLSSSVVSSHSIYHTLPVHTGLDAPGAGGADLHRLWAPEVGVLAVLCLPHLSLSQGEHRIASCVHLVSWDLGSELLESGSWGCGS